MATTDVRESAHWRLFSDWCAGTNRTAMPAKLVTVGEFLAACPCTAGVAKARMRTIAAVHAQQGQPLRVPPPITIQATAFRRGPIPHRKPAADGTPVRWLTLPEAFASLPVDGAPHGVAGRRDGFILAMIGALGFSLPQVRRLVPDSVDVRSGGLTINDLPVPVSDQPSSCPRCAVTRWLRVLSAWHMQWSESVWHAIDIAVSEKRAEHRHDCAVPVPGGWGAAQTLVPALERGELYPYTLSRMGIGALRGVLRRRQDPNVLTAPDLSPTHDAPAEAAPEPDLALAPPIPISHVGRKLSRNEHDELDDLFSALDERTELLMSAVEQIMRDQGVKVPKRRRRRAS